MGDDDAHGDGTLPQVAGRVRVGERDLAPDRACELGRADGGPGKLGAERRGGEDERHRAAPFRYAARCRHVPSGPVGAASAIGRRPAAPALR